MSDITREEAIEMMRAKLECMTREVSGTNQDCNAKRCDECDLCYAQGNMGEQKEWLRMGIKALENQRIGHWERKHNSYTLEHWYKCSECGDCSDYKTPYCQYCGAKMNDNIFELKEDK